MNKKAMIIGAVTGVIMAVFLQLLIPLLLGFLLSVVISGATALDPLYANDRLDLIWNTFGQLAALQTGQTLITAVLAGAVAGKIGIRREACSGYVLAGGASAIVHVMLLFVFAMILPIFVVRHLSESAVLFALMLALTMGFLLGVVSAMAARKWGMVQEQEDEQDAT